MKSIKLSSIHSSIRVRASALTLIASTSSSVEDAILYYWDSGSDMSFIDMKGVVFSPLTGIIVPLKGHRNVGIHTGHNPVFYLSYKVRWKNIAGYILREGDENRPIVANIQDYPEYVGKEEIPFPYLKGLWED